MKASRALALVVVIAAVLVQPTVAAANPIMVQALGTGDPALTAADLAQDLVGTGVTVSNVTYAGASDASGRFSDGAAPVGFASGVLLTSGHVNNVVGPNDADNTSTINSVAGDTDLDALATGATEDASVLEFDFVPAESPIFFRYVFGSEEYNEFVNTQFNDVFGFFVNGGASTNCAVVPGTSTPVSINTINGGNPFGENASNPGLYRNNDLQDGGGSIDTELDGLTTLLTCTANVTPGVTNHVKLAIADVSDAQFDSAVFLEAGSFSTEPPGRLISGSVINDADGDGQIGEGEGGLAGATVTLFEETGDIEFPTLTQVGDPVVMGEDGAWTFADVAPGTYRVQETNPEGYTSTGAVAGTGATVMDNDTIRVVLGGEADSTGNAFLDQAEAEADLNVDKVGQPTTVTANEDIRYTVTVDNVAGLDDASNVVVTDTLPQGTTFLGVSTAGEIPSWDCSFQDGEVSDTVTCTRTSLAFGETAPAIFIDVQAPSTPGTIQNIATVSADQNDPNEGNNTATATTAVEGSGTADTAATFCADGCTLDTDTGTGATPGDQTVTFLIVPDDADPQTVSIAEIPSSTPGFTTFCGNQKCNGQIVTITGEDTDGGISGVHNQNEPIIVKLVYDKSVKGGTQIYIKKPGFTTAKLVANCATPGVASPHPCVSSKIILPGGDKEITVLLLSEDPSLGKR